MKSSFTNTLSLLLIPLVTLCTANAAEKKAKYSDTKIATAGDKVDRNNDDKLSHRELDHLQDRYADNRAKAQARILKQFDTDNDGKLDREEQAARQAHRQRAQEQRKERMLSKYDANGDGKITEAEKELKQAQSTKTPKISPGRIADRDKNGKLSQAELNKFADRYEDVADASTEEQAEKSTAKSKVVKRKVIVKPKMEAQDFFCKLPQSLIAVG